MALIVVVIVAVVVVTAYLQKRKTAARFKVPKKWAPPAPPKQGHKELHRKYALMFLKHMRFLISFAGAQ